MKPVILGTGERSNGLRLRQHHHIILPTVTDRDAFWEQKQRTAVSSNTTTYSDIELPKNSSLGIYIGGFALVLGFAIIWHIWWLAVLGLIGIIITVVYRSLDTETEIVIPAAEIAHTEKLRRKLA
jgi:cytochrome o ubiquinol oxidase subunit 1